MAKVEVGRDTRGRVVSEYDTLTRTIGVRSFTTAENAAQDSADALQSGQVQNKSTIEINLNQDYLNMQAIKAQTNAAIRSDPSQEIKELSDAVRRLTRMALENFSGTD